MKRNTKGFTLVELLAALVILGILMVVSIPTILNMLENNRNRVYIDDAKKMIAQAEYRIRANNSTIEKPSEGSAIVISLGYLESSDFDNPPNNGEYLKEASYVVIKNTGRKLEYSASIVEKMKKGGYKGVVLTKSSNLLKNNANKYVKVFTNKDLYYVETAPIGKSLSSGEINKFLGNDYCEEIETVYNDIELSDDVVQKADNPPKIKSLTIASASNRDFNSFDALLTLKAEDDNTLKKDLKVYVSTVSYDDALREVNGETYGSGKDYYTKNINFSDAKYGGYKKYDGSKITVYVVVKDNVGNVTKKIQEYYLHNNAAPIIDKNETKIYKRTTDKFSMPKATLKLAVSDDDDARENLLICLQTSKDACPASAFRKYKNYFGSGTTMTYDFGGIPDGREMTLHIEVKDKNNMLTSTNLEYQIYNNQPPKVNSISVTSSNNDLPASVRGDKGDLTANFSVNVSDDFGGSNIRFSVQDVTSNKAATEFQYTSCSSGNCSYKVGGKYDGGTRKLKFIFKDQFGATTEKEEFYTVYENEAPSVSASVVTQKDACPNTSFCRNSNSVDTYVQVNATDDIDYINNYANLKVCLSRNENDCKKTSSSNYKSYSQYINKATSLRLSDAANPYDGDTKKIYVYVVDTYGAVAKVPLDYTLYQNKKPTDVKINVETVVDANFSYHSFSDSDYGPFNLKDVLVTFSADDDFGTDNLQVDFCYRRASDKSEGCVGYQPYSSFINSQYKLSLPETKYKGQDYTIILKIKDAYGEVITKEKNYTLFKDLAPKIDNFEISSSNDNYHTTSIYYTYRARDAFDTYSVCIGGRKNKTTSVTYAQCSQNHYYIKKNINGNNTNAVSGTINLKDFGWSYDNGTRKNVYLVVKDSNDHEKVVGEDYAVYKYCTNLSNSYEAKYELAPGEKKITAERCDGRCYQDIVNPDDLSDPENINVNIKAKYNETLTYKDKYFDSHKCIEEKQISRNCDYYTCYKNGTGYYKAVGAHGIKSNWSHKHEDGKNYSHAIYYPIYKVTYDADKDLLKFTKLSDKICINEIDKYNLEEGYVYTDNYDEGGA